MHILFTSATGVYLFDESNSLVKKKEFGKKEIEKYSAQLANGAWIEPELEMLKGQKVLFLGIKSSKQENVILSQDITKFEKLSSVFTKKALKQSNYLISKQDFNCGYTEDVVVVHFLRMYDEIEHVFNSMVMRMVDLARLYAPELLEPDKPEKVLEIFGRQKDGGVGYPLAKEHLALYSELSKKIKQLGNQRILIEEHLSKTMERVCPNILGLLGPLLGARLISLAGSLIELAKMPYSTAQLLGAEKALFRHIRKGSKGPKHGIIITHPVVSSATKKGKAARLLAGKISKAARLDYFKGADLSKEMLEDIKRKL